MYADPHPGNFLFMPDGRLGLLDFGCCRFFNDQEWLYYLQCTRTFRDGGRPMQETLAAAIDVPTPEDMSPDHLRILTEVVEWYNEPMRTDLFDFSNEDYIRRGIAQQREVISKRYMRSLPINMWINRALMGVRAMAHRLGARVPMKKLAEDETAGLLD
jgi:predicted unusual protein kinase regulating ubiquinone biosynthesis (AarF/ABC1/UbiB family)